MRVAVLLGLVSFSLGCVTAPYGTAERCALLSKLAVDSAEAIADLVNPEESQVAALIAANDELIDMLADFGCDKLFPEAE